MEPFSTSHFSDEPLSGCARVVRLGGHIYVSGTTATDELGRIAGVGDPAAQFVQALKNVEVALSTVGANLSNIVATRVLLLAESHEDVVRRAHHEFFGPSAPPLSFVPVTTLLDPLLLLELEAEAVLES